MGDFSGEMVSGRVRSGPPMKTLFPLSPLVWMGLLTVPAGLSRAQTIAEALDTPALTWTPSGAVTPLNEAGFSHDGMDVVRLEATTNASTGGPWPSVKTTVTVPSVVEFWHRSEDLAAITTLGRNTQPVAVSSYWKKERWVQFPANALTSGELEIGNRGAKGSGLLYLDEVSIVPATVVSLAEALDFPGFIGSSTSAAGLAEGWLAPDGVDAVVFPGKGSILSATLPGPGLIRFRHGGGNSTPQVQVVPVNGGSLPSLVQEDFTWAWVSATGDYQFNATGPTNVPAISRQVPIVMDALERPPAIPLNEALDAPGLNFAVTGLASGVGSASGAPDGDALLCLKRTEGVDPESEVSLTVSGPGIVRFSWRGSINIKRTGETFANGGTSASWQTLDIPVYRSGETLTWKTSGDGFWLDAVRVLPPAPETSVAGLLNAPDLVPEILVPAYLGPTAGQLPDDLALAVHPDVPMALQPVLRLPFHGASLLSLQVTDHTKSALVRIDGGVWQTPEYLRKEPFRAIVPGSGPHTLEVTGPVVLDHFQVIPLTAVPLAEALDAPGLTITTSTEHPWSGYTVPAGAGFLGNHGAFGGDHATASDPWIETQFTGPGFLRSAVRLHAGSAGTPLSLGRFPQLFINGVLTDPYFAPAEALLGPGQHTARWVQQGSQTQTGAGTLASLDAVSFEPLVPISFGEAMETPGRIWTPGGAGGATPVAWAAKSPDGVDSVQFQNNPTPNPSWVETAVKLPCRVSFRGKEISVSVGNGAGLFHLAAVNATTDNPNGFSSLRQPIPGNGPALIRFTATSASSVLDAVDIEQTSNGLLEFAVIGPSGLSWSLYGGQAWQVVPNEATGLDRYRTRPDGTVWMETMVNGPGKLNASAVTITLPDHDNRLTDFGWIPYSGPQRVLVSLSANTLPGNTSFTPTAPIDSWTGSPVLTWTTGGDVPWQSTSGQNPGSVRSGVVWPGEVSWIEAAVTGPGVLFWDSTKTGTNVFSYFTCDGIAMPAGVTRGWLHLGNGAHRVRWEMANPRNGFANATGVLLLKNVAFTPQPEQSLASVLGAGALNFAEFPPVSPSPNLTAPLPWPSPTGWQIVEDPGLPGPAVRGDFQSGSLTAFFPSPGQRTTQLKMEGATYPGAAVSSSSPEAAAPFPWLPWTSPSNTLPQGDGFQTFAAQSVFVPDAPVSVGEALDQPDLTWTTGSYPPGLWQPLKTASSLFPDQDALHLVRGAMGDLAWVETTVTGPLRVTTNFDGIGPLSATGIRIFVDGVLVVPDTLFPTESIQVNVPAGQHQLRWEIDPLQPLPAPSGIALRSITTSATTSPDVPALLDAPGLEWASTGSGAMTALTTGTHDGVDALGLGANRLVAGLNGPGVLTFWMKTGNLSNGLSLDSVAVPVTSGNPSTWFQYTLPIPQGRHTVTIAGNTTTALDEFSFQALLALSAAAALDAPAGVTISIPDPDKTGAAAWPGFSDDATDSFLLMPGLERRLALQVPPLSSITLRVRAAFGTGTFGFQDLASAGTTTTWTTRTFSTQNEGGLSTIYLRAGTVPVLLDKLSVNNALPGSQYFPWAANAGLSASQQATTADPDGDGLTNFAEYAFGLDPVVSDASRSGTDTVPGLPAAFVFTAPDGTSFLELRFWRRSAMAASVETATQPSGTALLGDSAGWILATNVPTITNQPGGWVRSVWRSPTPIASGTRQFVRVRTYLP